MIGIHALIAGNHNDGPVAQLIHDPASVNFLQARLPVSSRHVNSRLEGIERDGAHAERLERHGEKGSRSLRPCRHEHIELALRRRTADNARLFPQRSGQRIAR